MYCMSSGSCVPKKKANTRALISHHYTRIYIYMYAHNTQGIIVLPV